jgi:hypothetical protein
MITVHVEPEDDEEDEEKSTSFGENNGIVMLSTLRVTAVPHPWVLLPLKVSQSPHG